MVRFATALALSGLLALAGAARAQSTTFSFGAYSHYSLGPPSGPKAIAVADVNNDGRPDILTANDFNDTAGVLLGNGSGTFPATAIEYPAGGTAPSQVAVADIDQDHNPDLLLANTKSNTVSLLKGNGDGTFQTAIAYPTGSASQPYDMVVADLNGDGRPDILTANYGSHKVGVLLGNTAGTFQPVVEYATGAPDGPNRLAVADVTSDGHLDVLTANGTSVRVLPGSGTGTLQAPVTIAPATAAVYNLAVADVTRDGQPDLLLVADNASQVSVLPGTGNGTFQPGSSYTTSLGPVKVVAADLNQDGFADLVTGNVGGGSSNTTGQASVSVLLGGSGGFQAARTYTVYGKYNPIDIVVADLNADGQPDLLVAHYQANWIEVFLNTTPLPTRAALPGTTATLAPNPATAATTLTLAGLPASVSRVEATVLDAIGREVARHSLAAAQGTARAELATAGLNQGLYVVRLLALDARGQAAGVLATQHLSVE